MPPEPVLRLPANLIKLLHINSSGNLLPQTTPRL